MAVTTYTWNTATSADWRSFSGNWTRVGDAASPYPNAIESDATIDIAGTYTVTVSFGETVVADYVLLDNATATLLIKSGGTLDFTGSAAHTLMIQAGTLSLAGTIKGATIALPGGSVAFNGGAFDGTFSGVTFQGLVDLSGAGATLHLANGFTATGSGGTGPGTIDLTGNGASLYIDDSETLDNATVNIGGSSSPAFLYSYDANHTRTVVTFGPNLHINQTGAYARLDVKDAYGIDGAGFDNKGSISAGVSGGLFTVDKINGSTNQIFTNEGSIAVSNGDNFTVNDLAFVNTGSVSLNGGASMALYHGLTNTGAISVTDSTLILGYNFTAADLAGITVTNGTLEFTGVLLNSGNTLDVGTGTRLGTVVLTYGAIVGGTLHNAGDGFIYGRGWFSGVTYQGLVDLSADKATLILANGFTATGSGGTGPGTIDLTGNGASLSVYDSETLDNATVNIGASSSQATLYSYDNGGSQTVVTFGPNLHINQTGAYAGFDIYEPYGNAGSGFDNQGSINAGVTGGVFTLDSSGGSGGEIFTNEGRIAISNGDRFLVSNVAFVNTGSIDISAGGYLDATTGLNGAGTLTLHTTGTLDLGAASNTTVTFADPGTLIIDNGVTYTGILSGLNTGAGIQLSGLTLTDAQFQGNQLVADIQGGGTISFTVSGSTTNLSIGPITTGSDGLQDLITISPVCFYPGTRIATPTGEAAVETLAIGDIILTASGETHPILWIGRQTISTRFADPLRVLPIRITKGALGDNLPARDLLVSPRHALLVGNILVEAAALVNGATIIRETNVPETFTYFHIELADHALILAEGQPAETFVDNASRENFDNWEEHQALFPNGHPIPELPLPRAQSRRQLPRALRRAA